MTENRSDIDINDPEFWQKWAKKADIDTEAGNSKVLDDTVQNLLYFFCYLQYSTKPLMLLLLSSNYVDQHVILLLQTWTVFSVWQAKKKKKRIFAVLTQATQFLKMSDLQST